MLTNHTMSKMLSKRICLRDFNQYVVLFIPWIGILTYWGINKILVSEIELALLSVFYVATLYSAIVFASLLVRSYLKSKKEDGDLARRYRLGRWFMAVWLLLGLILFEGPLFFFCDSTLDETKAILKFLESVGLGTVP